MRERQHMPIARMRRLFAYEKSRHMRIAACANCEKGLRVLVMPLAFPLPLHTTGRMCAKLAYAQLTWRTTIRRTTIWRTTIWHTTIRRTTIRHTTIWRTTIWYITIWRTTT
jgi:hypothetical protein